MKQEKAPYLTVLYDKNTNTSIFCVIHLLSKSGVSYYEINDLQLEDYPDFMNMVKKWWVKSPLIPISIYYKGDFNRFKYCLKRLYRGKFEVIGGFNGISLKYLSDKRIKRKLINII